MLIAGASSHSPAVFSPSPSRLTVPTSLPRRELRGLVHVLANELRGRNITVNAVAPGQVRTDLFLKGKSDALIEELKKMNPLERLGLPEDMANLVSFLAGPEGGWINSQALRANGGFAY